MTSENVGNYKLKKLDKLKYVETRFNEIEPRSVLQKGDILLNHISAGPAELGGQVDLMFDSLTIARQLTEAGMKRA